MTLADLGAVQIPPTGATKALKALLGSERIGGGLVISHDSTIWSSGLYIRGSSRDQFQDQSKLEFYCN